MTGVCCTPGGGLDWRATCLTSLVYNELWGTLVAPADDNSDDSVYDFATAFAGAFFTRRQRRRLATP